MSDDSSDINADSKKPTLSLSFLPIDCSYCRNHFSFPPDVLTKRLLYCFVVDNAIPVYLRMFTRMVIPFCEYWMCVSFFYK